MDLIQTLYDDRHYCILHLDTSLPDLDLDSESWEREKAKLFPIISQFSIDLNGIWYAIQPCWWDELHSHFISSIQYSGREPYLFI